MANTQKLEITGTERFFDPNEIIVSKTDLKGKIAYANRLFIDLSGYTEEELLEQPHSILRHPEMPRCIFKLLWDSIQSKNEIFAYVVNRCKNGDHYWVLAHVTPSLNPDGDVDGYHSNRRVPDRAVLQDTIIPLYKTLREEEQRHNNAKQGMESAFEMFNHILHEKGMRYDEFVFSLKN